MKRLEQVIAFANSQKSRIGAINSILESIGKELIRDIKENAPRLIDFNKRMTGYGTYIITAFVNEYHYAQWADFLIKFKMATHNDEYCMNNFISDIEFYMNDSLCDYVFSQEKSEW